MKGKKKAYRFIEIAAFFVLLLGLLLCLTVQMKQLYWNMQGTVQQKQAEQKKQESWALFQPAEIYLTPGRGREKGYGRLIHADEEFAGFFSLGLNLLQCCLAEGKGEKIQKEDFPWDRAGCVFLYHFQIDREILQAVAGKKSLEKEITGGEEIWIFPSASFQESVEICIADWEAETFWKIELSGHSGKENKKLLKELNSTVSKIKREWLCLRESFPNSFQKNQFISREEKTVSLEMCILGAPFLSESGTIQKGQAGVCAAKLFGKSETIMLLEETEDRVIYVNEGATTTIHKNGKIHYAEALVEGKKRNTSIVEDYEMAWGFIEKKINPYLPEKMECRLVGYSRDEEGICFYFDYFYHSLRIEMEWMKEAEKEPLIEIRVEGGQFRSCSYFPLQRKNEYVYVGKTENSWMRVIEQIYPKNSNLYSELNFILYKEGWAALDWKFFHNVVEEGERP